MARLVQVSVSFQYPSSAYVATTSGGAVNQQVTVLQPPPASTPVTMIDTLTGNPATVYADSSGNTTVSSLTTDTGGNISGQPWVREGHYTITASPSGAFTGATIFWDAVRGDGLSNLYNLVVNTGQIADGAITLSKLAPTVAQALVPTGAIVPYGASLPPTGYVKCDGSIYAQAGSMSALFAVIGTIFNTGAEGAGNFRVPDLRSRFPLGTTGSNMGLTGGALGHTHPVPALTIDSNTLSGLGFSLTVPGHRHSLSNNGGAAISHDWDSSIGIHFAKNSSNVSVPFPNLRNLYISLAITNWPYNSSAVINSGFFAQPTSLPAAGLVGNTDSNMDSIVSGTTGSLTIPAHATHTGATGANDPPFVVVNYAIKT